MTHRGPDDYGFACISGVEQWHWSRGSGSAPPANIGRGITLGHRRLSIIDLSDLGRQPFATPDEKYWLVFNGEIYNYQEIRRELICLGYQFRSESDTEVLLTAFVEWDTDCFSKFNGMWAVVIWDGE